MILMNGLEMLSSDNHLDRTNALTSLENNISKIYDDSFENNIQNYFISVWDKQEKNWVKLNALLILNNLYLIPNENPK